MSKYDDLIQHGKKNVKRCACGQTKGNFYVLQSVADPEVKIRVCERCAHEKFDVVSKASA